MSNSITLSALGPGPTMTTPSGSFFLSGATILCTVSLGASLVYKIDVSNDGVNWNVADLGIGVFGTFNAAASGLTSSINFAVTSYTNYWRLNVTSYTSGSVSASFAPS